MRPLLSEQALAEAFGNKPNTLAKWRVRGIGPKFIRIGGKIAYDPADVEEWLGAQKAESTSQAA